MGRASMTDDSDFADEVWRALWASMAEPDDASDSATPPAEELRLLLAAAARLPPDKLRTLIAAVRAAVGH
jgi:hypothetical protein